MNILYLHMHDMGRYNSAYGHNLPTPRIQALAEQGTLFRQGFCNAPTCSPSRAALLTGFTAHQAGMTGLVNRGFGLKAPDPHLARFLQGHGYETILGGVQHEFKHTAIADFYNTHLHRRDELPTHEDEYPNAWDKCRDIQVAESVAACLRERTSNQPFFLSYGLIMPHRVLFDARPYKERYNPAYVTVPPPLPDTPEVRQDMADFAYTMAYVDHCVGIVLDALHDSGHDDDTLVFLTTDHGIAFPWMKCNLTDHGTGVTYLLRYPGNPTAGTATDALVSHLDFFPTVCDLLGIDAPDHLLGKSLRPVLEGQTDEHQQDLFAEVSYHAAYEPMRSVRTRRWKLIKLFEEGADYQRPFANIDASYTKDVVIEAGLHDIPRDPVQLYDLVLDPVERHNLAHSPAHVAILEDMTARLDRWMRETDDPLLNGPVNMPPTAKINKRHHLDPEIPDDYEPLDIR
ncbi:MAG: sulfatase [Opitutales bacterium]